MMEIRLGQTAQTKAMNSAVKQFGQRMVNDHTNLQNQVASLVTANKVSVSQAMNSKNQDEFNRVNKISGQAFDSAYMNLMVQAHRQDIANFQTQSQSAKSTQVRTLATNSLPVLQQHLSLATQVASQVGITTNVVTDTSFRARLAHVTYIDTTRADTIVRYAVLVESDREIGQRLGAAVVNQHNVHDMVTDPFYMTLVALYQYLVGNTDWSVWGQHNIAVFSDTASHKLFAIPYDYDFSGAVDAPYASPPEQLPIKTVRERLYRGYCQPDSILGRALARFRGAKDSIYATVRGVTQLDERDRHAMLSYFDDFFRTVENRTLIDREFVRRCRVLEQ